MNIDHPGLKQNIAHAGTFGNKSAMHSKLEGVDINTGDVVRFGILPAGTTVMDFREKHGATGTASQTMTFGYRPVDGSAGGDDALMAATAIDTAGHNRSVLGPVTLQKDSYIVGVGSAHDGTNAVDIEVVVDYVYNGPYNG